MADELRVRGGQVQSLQRTLSDGSNSLKYVPELVKRVIREDSWRERIDASTGQHVEFASFRDFVERPLIEGLGADVPTLKRMCSDDAEALDLLDQATTGKQGRPTKEATQENTSNRRDLSGGDAPAFGTTAEYALRKLRKDRPDLHAEVIAGEKSPHAAMVEAGFRPKTFSIRAEPDAIAALALKHLDYPQLREMVRLIVRGSRAQRTQ